MERFDDIDLTKLQALVDVQTAHAQSEVWGDGDLNDRIDDDGYPTNNPRHAPLDRRTREVVCYFAAPAAGTWKATRLKRGDHVMLLGVIRAVVAMPARGRSRFLAYAPGAYRDDELIAVEWSVVTDRAPADPGEAPMPLDTDAALQLEPEEEDPIAVLELSAQKAAITKVGDP